MHQLRLKDGTCFYRQVGQTGPAVILLHGFGSHSSLWLPYIWNLPFRIFLPDLPGFGKSKPFPLPHSDFLRIYADVIDRLIEDNHLDEVILGGYSLGAYACLNYFSIYGTDKIQKYLHIDHSPMTAKREGWTGHIHPDLLSLFEQLHRMVEKEPWLRHVSVSDLPTPLLNLYVQTLEALGEKSFTSPALRSLNRWIHHSTTLRPLSFQRCSWPWAFSVIENYLKGTYDFRETLKQLDLPVTVVSGAQSTLFSSEACDFMLKHLPHSEHVPFARSGHDLLLHSPFYFFKVLRHFLFNPPSTSR